MNCPTCNAPIDAEKQACLKCGPAMASTCEKPGPRRSVMRSLDRILSWIIPVPIVLILMLSFNGNPVRAMLKANMLAVEIRGKDIYIAILTANTERALSGLSSIWPKTCLMVTNGVNDISGQAFITSTEYFKALYDEKNRCTESWKPYVKDFDYSKLAGAGVPCCCLPKNTLAATNNMWIIAANIMEQDDKRTPVLLTRNVDVKEIERVVNQGLTKDEFKKKIVFSEKYREPFFDKGFVVIRMGGRSGVFRGSENVTLGDLFSNKELPPRDPSKPPIVYLMP
jgi:hypothetical protein